MLHLSVLAPSHQLPPILHAADSHWPKEFNRRKRLQSRDHMRLFSAASTETDLYARTLKVSIWLPIQCAMPFLPSCVSESLIIHTMRLKQMTIFALTLEK